MLISADLLKIALHHTFILCFYNELIFGGAYIRGGLYTEPLLCQYFDGLIYEVAYIRGGASIRSLSVNFDKNII